MTSFGCAPAKAARRGVTERADGKTAEIRRNRFLGRSFTFKKIAKHKSEYERARKMANCPNCNKKLKFWQIRAECPYCGANIPNFNWEGRLQEDADTAERAFAKFHWYIANFKSGVWGSPLRKLRLFCTFLPLIALVLPLMRVSISVPFYEMQGNVSFLNFVLDYLTKFDIGAVLSLTGGEVLGEVMQNFVIGVGLIFLAVLCGVLNFFVLLIGAFRLNATVNVALNAVSTVSFGAAAVFLMRFSSLAAANTVELFGGSVSFGFSVGVILFGLNVVLSVLTAKSFKKQRNESPSMEKAIENEIAAL